MGCEVVNDVLIGAVVVLGTGTPVRREIVVWPATASTMVDVVESRLACAIPIKSFSWSNTTYAERKKKVPRKEYLYLPTSNVRQCTILTRLIRQDLSDSPAGNNS